MIPQDAISSVWKHRRFSLLAPREFWHSHAGTEFWVIVRNCPINHDLEMTGFTNDSGGLVRDLVNMVS